ncbi:MAG: nuclear transport factor 2 family protein [Chloroflexales bacterium]|nr:nuclear transport factor 2 family protein [Chloroflexales bacterium]
MTTNTHEQAQRFIDALHDLEQNGAERVEGIVALFSDDAKLTNAALARTNDGYEGRDGVKTFWTEYRKQFGQVLSNFSHVTSSDDAAGLFWRTEGTYADGAPMGYDGVSLLVFNDEGKISSFRGYYDTRELNRMVASNQ